jgi:hypothetical protein
MSVAAKATRFGSRKPSQLSRASNIVEPFGECNVSHSLSVPREPSNS